MYQLLYLVDQTPYYSPVLHALRQRVIRVSGAELVPYLGLSFGPSVLWPFAKLIAAIS